MMRRRIRLVTVCAGLLIGTLLLANLRGVSEQENDWLKRLRARTERAEQQGLAEDFKGVTVDGEIIPDLFHIRSTGVSTEPVRQAALAFLDSLTPEQLSRTVFKVDDLEWHKWRNQHSYLRQGVGFEEMSLPQREAAFGLLRSSLSARGLKLSRDIMKLNHTLGELDNDNFVEYGEWLYWITVMGVPSSDEPWGWQLDGHHLIINYFVLGDQVVMTPHFFGSEPVIAKSGKYKGLVVMQEEQAKGLAMLRALSPGQRQQAVLEVNKTGNNNLAEAFRDNLVLDYAGVSVSSFSETQKKQMLDLIEFYVGNMRQGHAEVRMEEVKEHLDTTRFAWIGGDTDESVFYYYPQPGDLDRVRSPEPGWTASSLSAGCPQPGAYPCRGTNTQRQ